ncbi:myb-related transcription factor, partner of profilin-like [Ambystoma mexicanum]|uniref:myb-related transcription factor, partner of profilin-like n=1 Tax=Ambystoma mexicanum TaxID=8296 RepID=UPI0037E84FFF
MASRFPATRQRKQRFSEAELTVPVEHIVGNADMLFSADQWRSTQQHHKEVWAEAACRCTAVGVTIRTVKDCHKRWDDLRLRVRNLIAAHRQHSTDTGGGPASPLRLQSWEDRCSSILHLEGIQGVGEAEVGVCPPADAARSGTDAPTYVANPVQPAATQVAPITTVATKTIDLAVCTEEDAASCGDSAPVVQYEDARQEEVYDMGDLSSLHNLQFSPPDLHSPMRSTAPSMAELSARMQCMEEQQTTLAQLVESQLEEVMQQREEARLQREITAMSVRRLSRAIGRFATPRQ